MKKTTAKGAYKKGAKRNMMKRNAPFKETKQREAYEVIARNSGVDPRAFVAVTLGETGINYVSIPLNPFYRMSMGIREDQAVGRSEYGKWLKCKYSIKFPTAANAIILPMRVYQVHGWVKPPLAYTAATTPTEGNATQQNLVDHISHQLSQYFDNAKDKLSFIPKNTNIKILGYKQIKNDRNAQLTGDPAAGNAPASGVTDTINRSCTWTIMRKITRSIGTPDAANDNSDRTDTQNMYPNNNYLPFLYLFTPDDGAIPAADNRLQIAHNSIYYYTDS